MASTLTKQQHYRRLMKEQKRANASKGNKIHHPLARYNALDQLTCVVCSVQVKSEILWATHLQSHKHKDAVAALKVQTSSDVRTTTASQSQGTGKPPNPNPLPLSAAEQKPSEDELPPKKKKARRSGPSATPAPTSSGLPSDFFDTGVSKKFYPQGEEPMYVSSDSDDETPATNNNMPTTKKAAKQGTSSTSEVTPSTDTSKGKLEVPAPKNEDSTKSLPEGFFDDPKMDAKARKVEYKDPMTEEWERFQKSIQKENDVSEALIFEVDEETMEERDLDQVNQQVDCFSKAELLRQKHEELVAKRVEQEQANSVNAAKEDSNSSDEEVDFDEFLNWRAKIS